MPNFTTSTMSGSITARRLIRPRSCGRGTSIRRKTKSYSSISRIVKSGLWSPTNETEKRGNLSLLPALSRNPCLDLSHEQPITVWSGPSCFARKPRRSRRRGKSTGGAECADVRCNFVEGALGAGDDFVGAEALKDFGEFVEIAADDDGGFLVALAGALGDEESGFDIVGGDDDEIGAFNARINECDLLLGVIHDDRLAGANQVVDRRGIFVDQHVSASALPEVRDEARAQMSVADDNHVIFHFAGKHAASFLRIVALQRLKNENGNDDSEQNALAPERIEYPQRSRLHAEVNGGQKGIGQRKLLEAIEDDSSESEPEREQRKTPAALTEKDREPYPKEAPHGYLTLLHEEHGTRSRRICSRCARAPPF